MTVKAAINESILRNRIVTIENATEEQVRELQRACDDSVDTTWEHGDLIEFWGRDDAGDRWRVHAQLAQEEEA